MDNSLPPRYRHLVDMNNVTLHAEVATTPAENCVQFVVTGAGSVRESVRRMAKAHAETMSGANRMTIVAQDHPEGAVMTVTVENLADLPRGSRLLWHHDAWHAPPRASSHDRSRPCAASLIMSVSEHLGIETGNLRPINNDLCGVHRATGGQAHVVDQNDRAMALNLLGFPATMLVGRGGWN